MSFGVDEMRILVLSNFYPPYTIGGMEYRCQEVVNNLRFRGHEVQVLTAKTDKPVIAEQAVYRLLTLESALYHYQPFYFFLQWPADQRQNLRYLEEQVHAFKPDIIFIWGMWNLSPALAQRAEQLCPGGVVYSIAQDWPVQPDIHTVYWTREANHVLSWPIKRLLRKLAGKWLFRHQGDIKLHFAHAIVVSFALRDHLLKAGVPLQDVRVIYPGIDLNSFLPAVVSKGGRVPILRLLCAGNLAEHKGVHTALEAVRRCTLQKSTRDVHLTILGNGHPDYIRYLKKVVVDHALQEYVTFMNWVPRAEMPQLLRAFHVLLFPSMWDEPFSRMVLEAMAVGLVVVGSSTGGTVEILQHKINALTFDAGDADALAKHLYELVQDDELRLKLAQNGQQEVVSHFSLDRMIDAIEGYLHKVLKP
jgi:glycosyltransferase involved in cell wall biosynthesis